MTDRASHGVRHEHELIETERVYKLPEIGFKLLKAVFPRSNALTVAALVECNAFPLAIHHLHHAQPVSGVPAHRMKEHDRVASTVLQVREPACSEVDGGSLCHAYIILVESLSMLVNVDCS